jgi:hypothetical protein
MVTADPPRHSEALDTPEELAAFAADQKGERSIIMFDLNHAVFVYDLGDRRDVAYCMMRTSPQFEWLKVNGGKNLSQVDIVRALRISLRGAVDADSSPLRSIRSLKWNASAEGAAELQHGRESIGKTIQRSVQGFDSIPEEFAVTTSVFENHRATRSRILCAIEVMVSEQAFRITPYPSEMDAAMDAALAALRETLGKAGIPVYCGRPQMAKAQAPAVGTATAVDRPPF